MTDPRPADAGSEGKVVEVEARTVDEAVARGLVRLGGLSRSEVKIDVINEGKSGLLGFGAEEALVRLTVLKPGERAPEPKQEPKQEPVKEPKASKGTQAEDSVQVAEKAKPKPKSKPKPKPKSKPKSGKGKKQKQQKPDSDVDRAGEPKTESKRDEQPRSERRRSDEPREELTPADIDAAVEASREFLKPALEQLGFENVSIERSESLVPDGFDDDRSVVLTIKGDGTDRLLNDDAKPLLAMQFLTRMIVSRRTDKWVNLLLDVEGDRARRIMELCHLAEQSADLVEHDGRPVSLPPMSPYERRVVHLALREHETVITQSIGSGDYRKVTVRLKDQFLPNL